MLILHAAGSIANCHPYLDLNSVQHASSCKTSHVTSLSTSPNLFKGTCGNVHASPFLSWNYHKQHEACLVLHPVTSPKWMCRVRDSFSPDDEYRSSRNIAISLFKRYRNVIDRGGSENLKEFIAAGVNAYALGCTDEGLRKELTDLMHSGLEIEAMQSYGGSTSLKSKVVLEEINECIFWLSLVFITIMCTPQPTIVRWSSTSAVSDEVRLHWKGFCALIANAYYMKGMAWLPVKTLQLEQMAVMGRAEEPSLVASRMLLVFCTLEVVSPQWPRG